MDSTIISSIIGATSALLTFILKDVIISQYNKHKQNQEKLISLYRKYSLPIVLATESLSWRINEILEKRSDFLIIENHKGEFYRYKYISTLYRLAKVLGYLQAIENEISYLETGDANKNKKIINAISNFRITLSDGTHIEKLILKELLDLYSINIKPLPENLAVNIENIIIKTSSNGTKSNISTLNKDEKLDLLTKVMNEITNELSLKEISKEILLENLERSIRIIARKESWLYRDWQDDIGNKVIKQNSMKDRNFEIINFGEFEEIFNQNQQPIWITRLSSLFDNLNLKAIDIYDARTIQLNDLFGASISLFDEFWSLNKMKNDKSNKSLEQLKILKSKHNKLLE